MCFVTCDLNKPRAECTVKLLTKISANTITYTFTKITERFDPWVEIQKLKLVSTADGTDVTIECMDSIKDKKLDLPDSQRDSIYSSLDN